MEYVEITLVLNDAEFRYDLESDLDRWVSLDPDEEATFSVDEPNHPFRTEFHSTASSFFELDAWRIVSEDPSYYEVSCGLSNPGPLLLDRRRSE